MESIKDHSSNHQHCIEDAHRNILGRSSPLLVLLSMFLFLIIWLLQFVLVQLRLNLGVRCWLGRVRFRKLGVELLLRILCAIAGSLILRIKLGVYCLFSLSIQPNSCCTRTLICLLTLQWPFRIIFLNLLWYLLSVSWATALFLVEYYWNFLQIDTKWPIYPFLDFWLPDPALIFWSSSVSAIKNFKNISSLNICK